ncbi:GumC family protein [Zunongwangia sp.]|uniref:GumC family protein n=1 Tax=Zunongwangia sp. TaxID=1965325 RepID=UPI003AA863DC
MYNFRAKKEKGIGKQLKTYTKYWYWFAIAIICSLGIGYFYLKYATPVYNATASIIIKDKQATNNSDASFGFSGADILGMRSQKIESELSILKSRRLMEDVVKALNLNVSYSLEGKFRSIELYDDKPFTVEMLSYKAKKLSNYSNTYQITYLGDRQFRVVNLKTLETSLVKTNTTLDLGFSKIMLTKPSEQDKNLPIKVSFNSVTATAANYRNRINLSQAENNSNVIYFELKDPVANKAKNILDQLILEYNKDAIEDKNLIAENTANFINERLTIINGELDSVETDKVVFKKENKLTDLSSESEMFVRNASEYNNRKQEVGTQLELVNTILQYLSSEKNNELIPSNLGIEATGVNQQISEYNTMVLERNRLLNSSTEKNPMVSRIIDNIQQIKSNIIQSLKQNRSNLQIALNDLKRQSYSISSKILEIPLQEKQNRGIERQQKIKESLYLFLLQKREENTLALAVTEPKAKVVDQAYSTYVPVSPNPRSIFLGCTLLGFLLPFSSIYLFNVLDGKVRDKSDIQENLSKDIPLISEIPALGKLERNYLIKENDRSVLAESFRMLMVNLQIMLNKKLKRLGSRVIMVTSSIKGEGKTFTAMNLGITLANSRHKVLIIGADLRNPQLQRYGSTKTATNTGLREYLEKDEISLASLIEKTNFHHNMDILYSGNIPANPTELLKPEKLESMFTELRQNYDYILVDTAPSMLVADTSILNCYADFTLYLIKAGFTNKENLEFIEDAKENEILSNIGCVLNYVQFSNLRYGNKYGYGYTAKKINLK